MKFNTICVQTKMYILLMRNRIKSPDYFHCGGDAFSNMFHQIPLNSSGDVACEHTYGNDCLSA
jgi:hypothetical protein